ncbi:unnamed protein product [Phyllotreta striolata]|uniref:Cullin family profile domain-containing protein n=1 Tax=Phyllotreta striolata TaxID=444603 RepID=A0A9P0E103_PHYSR|nr:unnamed protein product [Phyllotreta striolata]
MLQSQLKMTLTKKTLVVKNIEKIENKNELVHDAIRSLQSDLDSILNSHPRKLSLQELYGIVENLHSTHRTLLYQKLEDILEEALSDKLQKLAKNDDNNNSNYTLTAIKTLWTEFCKNVCTIKNIFLNCDRSSQNSNKYNTVHQLTTGLFKTIIIQNPKIRSRLTVEILTLIEFQRKGNDIDTNLLKTILEMLTDLQMYDEIFQTEFLSNSSVFYEDEGNILINSIDMRAYLKHCQARIKEEQERFELFRNTHTFSSVSNILYQHLLKDHMQDILEKVYKLLDKAEITNAELGILYNLFKNVPTGSKSLVEYFVNYIMKRGSQIVNKPDNEKTMIQDLLDFKSELDDIVENGFKDAETFADIIRNCFIKFINSKQNKPAQLLAKYIDNKLRSKDLSDDQLESVLDKVMILFRFIQGKDIFEAFYKKDLAKRLLLGKSTSQDAEDSMIGKLKLECGASFTSKIEGMFKDINISRCMNNSFKQHLVHASPAVSSDLCINVLTSSFWPNYPAYKVNLPVELVNYQAIFQKFYSTNHNGRKLVWQPNLGHCIVKASFDGGNKELQVSLFQAIVLLLFNDSSKLTFGEMRELTNIDPDELKRILISLACAKSRVLVRQSKGKDVEAEDSFCVNDKFTDKLFRVKINQIQLKETVEDQQATERSVLTDRQFQIDAAVVRILKSKKKINHNELISELFNMLDIPVKPYDLKKRIELLIEREYMERDKNDPTNYIYVA